jgi:S-adenosylmethionine:tRNA ribosyltransferase-isomerase
VDKLLISQILILKAELLQISQFAVPMLNFPPKQLAIADFTYDLPENRISRFPLADRDASKLLIYKNGNISESTYRKLADSIPPGYLLVFNKTRVVEARIHFKKPSGGIIEIFCLEPHSGYPDITSAMTQTGEVKWNCLVGGASKWKHGMVLEKEINSHGKLIHLSASIDSRNPDTFSILFKWSPDSLTFAELLHFAGVIPIPPYLKRDSTDSDKERYQTIYAERDGSVAAPTAGLHFTDAVFEELKKKQVNTEFVTLHVGAGTFKPVKSEFISDHDMHSEFIEVDKSTLENILVAEDKVIAVGTTSLRALESIYWMGVKLSISPDAAISDLSIQQWEVYEQLSAYPIPVKESLRLLLKRMEELEISKIICSTRILMAPGYQVRMIKALITNFHQPQSTLLLLVAALIGDDWKKVYQYALQNDFRFLSYGDGSLLWCQ